MQASRTDDPAGIVSPDVATEQTTSENDEEKPWQAFLPMITKEMSGPIFHCFLRRAAAILSTVDLSLPCLPPLLNITELKSPVHKLTNASVGLLKLYHNTNDEAQRCTLLELVTKEKAFVYYVIQLTCKVMQLCDDPLVHLWKIPLVGFLELTAWTLECCSDFKFQIQDYGLLIKLLNHLKDVSLVIVQNLLEIVRLSVKILFQCAASCSSLQSKCIQLNYSQALLLLLQAPDIELRLITRAFLLSLSSNCVASKDVDTSHQVLRGDEISKLIEMLSAEPSLHHGFSYQLPFKMVEYSMKATENMSLFLQWGIPTILDQLSDKLRDEDQEKHAQLVWRLMQFESGDDFIGGIVTTATTTEFEVNDQGSYPDILPEEVLESLPEAEAAAEFTDLLLHYLIRTLLPYEGIPLEHGFEELSEATWYTIGECISLISMILAESDDSIKNVIIQCAAAVPGSCASMQLAFYIGTLIRKEGLPKSVMTTALDDLFIILMSWSDNRGLAHEIAKTGFVQVFTGFLTTGLYLSSIIPWLRTRLLASLSILFDISRDPKNYPAFFFCNTIRELIPYVHAQDFDLASTAKFILSFLHMHLDCDELLVLMFEDKEAEYCVDTLTSAINSPDFKADGISVFEFLEILTNMTHPYQSMEINISTIKHPSKKEKPVKMSYFDQKMLEAAEVFVRNSVSLIHLNIISLLENLLKEKKFQDAACKLLWNLLHRENVKKEVLSNHPGICEVLETVKISAGPDSHLSSHCCLWLLKNPNSKACIIDIQGCLKYAEGCYKFGCYEEAYSVCSKLIEYIKHHDEHNERVYCQANLLKGKAVFYSYQRKIMYYMVNKSAMAKRDEKKLISECFQSIAEAINLLGASLDKMYIDEEGSRLLDWAMLDCTRETNWLNLCNRCLLCRQPCRLCRSHIFPRFLYDRSDGDQKEKVYVFGKNKHQLKSSGECWVWLCCRRCESIMTQNAESDFSKRFRSSNTVEYTSWLFNYCCTILFRTLSCLKFPIFFNDDEVYEAFLSCRKHLLSLPVKVKDVNHTASTEMENYQLQLLSQVVAKEIQPFLFIIPSNVAIERNEFEGVHILEQGLLGANTLCFLSVRRLIDGRKDLARLAHFFVAYSYGMIILLQFSPSAQCRVPERYCISRLSGTYTIPNEKEAVELIPKGLWELHHSCSLEYFESITKALQELTSNAADKMISAGAFSMIPDELQDFYISEYDDQGSVTVGSEMTGINIPLTESTNVEQTMNSTKEVEYDTLTVPFPLSVDKPQLSMLPPEFKVKKCSKSLCLPAGHQIVLHDIEDSGDLTVFVAVGDSGNFALDHPYIVYLFDSSERTHTYVDGGFIVEVNEEICLTKFLMEHSIYAKSRVQLMQIEERAKALLKPMLRKNQFLSLQMLVHYVKCRWSIKDNENLPSLGLKCSPAGCWFCKLLCQYCMKPALWINVQDVSTDNQYRFCSSKCSELSCTNPSELPKDLFMIDHHDEFLEGKLRGFTVLNIVNACKEGNTYNTIEVISLCLGEHSDDQSCGHFILWQVRFIDFQYFRSFTITKDFEPVKILWSSILEDNKVFTLQEASKLQPYLSEIVERSVKELGYKDMATYIESFPCCDK